MSDYFKVKRPGLISTFQDLGRKNFYHIGLPFSGVMDKRNFLLLNKLCGNNLKDPVIEFAYQGPKLEFYGNTRNIVVAGNVNFVIKKKNKTEINGECYKSIKLENGDIIDIISTSNSVYGYFSVNGGFSINKMWGSYSTTIRPKVGANNGKKLQSNQKIFLNTYNNADIRKLDFINTKINFIRILKGTNFNFFTKKSQDEFFSKKFLVTKFSDRMGMRLEGPKIQNSKFSNIKSEGLVKGVIQIPTDGNPIIMLSDHGTIGGYPKFGVVISADYDKLVQIPTGSKIKFKLIELNEAENLYKLYNMETKNILNRIKWTKKFKTL